MGAMASQITSFTIVYSTVYSGADQRKHQSSASLAFVRGIQRWPVNSSHKWPVTRKMFPFDDVIMAFLWHVSPIQQYKFGQRWLKVGPFCQTITCGPDRLGVLGIITISHSLFGCSLSYDSVCNVWFAHPTQRGDYMTWVINGSGMTLFIQETALVNIIAKTSAILFKPHRVNSFRPSDACNHHWFR